MGMGRRFPVRRAQFEEAKLLLLNQEAQPLNLFSAADELAAFCGSGPFHHENKCLQQFNTGGRVRIDPSNLGSVLYN